MVAPAGPTVYVYVISRCVCVCACTAQLQSGRNIVHCILHFGCIGSTRREAHNGAPLTSSQAYEPQQPANHRRAHLTHLFLPQPAFRLLGALDGRVELLFELTHIRQLRDFTPREGCRGRGGR